MQIMSYHVYRAGYWLADAATDQYRELITDAEEFATPEAAQKAANKSAKASRYPVYVLAIYHSE